MKTFYATILLCCFSTIVAGQDMNGIVLTNQSNKDHVFYYHDSLAYGKPVRIEKGATIALDVSFPVFLFEADKNQIPYLIYPGEKLSITTGVDGLTTFLKDSNHIRNNELNFFKELVNETGMLRYILRSETPIPKNASLETRDAIIEALYQKRKHFLSSYRKSHAVSPGFEALCNMVFECYRINEKITLGNKNYNPNRLRAYYQPQLSSFDSFFSNDELIGWFPYREAGLSLFRLLVRNASLSEKIKVSTSVFKGQMKDFLITRSVADAIRLNETSIKDSLIEQVYKLYSFQDYRTVLKDRWTTKSELDQLLTKTEAAELLTSAGQAFSFSDILTKHKNKVLYLDFWASWCGPCRKEMPYSRQLHKDLADSNVVFIYISTDQGKEDWISASKQEGLTNANNYLLIQNSKGIIPTLFDLSSIPRYVLIDGGGRIVQKDASRPSDKATRLRILKLLKE